MNPDGAALVVVPHGWLRAGGGTMAWLLVVQVAGVE